jgi:hypothetical protein
MIRPLTAACLAALTLLSVARSASAFCGFYVAGGGAQLFNNATQVVLMREGQRTVLSMQNDYQGPPERFAMVVPVPVVLQKDNVKTLERSVFERIDQLTAPRLVEYWEQDPCKPEGYGYTFSDDPLAAGSFGPNDATIRVRPAPVRIEAAFAVGEYDIVILGADDSMALDRWLHDNGYSIPAGAGPVLRPYVEQGMKFFVAKVDVSKVKMQNGHAALSPLRFHYDTNDFTLPVRLGLLNSAGTQELIVNVLARGQRYEVANYDNVTIPTNLSLKPQAQQQFGAFYTSLFDATLATRPHSVVTEYSWQASSCDPCPTPPLDDSDVNVLGADVALKENEPRSSFVVTRLHARYTKDSLGDDLHFRPAAPISGGRGVPSADDGSLGEKTAASAGENNFQGRYVTLHPWKGDIKCDHPQRGQWGEKTDPDGTRSAVPATNLAFAPRGLSLASFLAEPMPAGITPLAGPAPQPPSLARTGGCAGCRTGTSSDGSWTAALSVLGLAFAWRARSRGRRR